MVHITAFDSTGLVVYSHVMTLAMYSGLEDLVREEVIERGAVRLVVDTAL